MGTMKSFFFLMMSIMIVFFMSSYVFAIHTGNVNSVNSSKVLDGNMALGVLRAEVNDEGAIENDEPIVDLAELKDNVYSRVSMQQKMDKHDKTIAFNYVNSSGQVTDELKDVRGVRYSTSVHNKKLNGKVTNDLSSMNRAEIYNIITETDENYKTPTQRGIHFMVRD